MYQFCCLPLILASFSLCADYHVKSTKNIGYPQHKLPVPATVCLSGNAVPGKTTTIHFGAAVEPSIAVNPRNSKQLVVCWLQDQISDGGALEIAIASTFDQGLSWKRHEIPIQICKGGQKQRVSHASVSWSQDGKRIYLTGHTINVNPIPNSPHQQAVFISMSEDGGKTWTKHDTVSQSVTTLEGPQLFALDENNSVTADPIDKKLAFTVWTRYPKACSFQGQTMISRTTDSGLNWTPHALLYDPFPDLCSHGLSNCNETCCQSINNRLVALPYANFRYDLWKNDTWGDLYDKEERYSGDLLTFMQRIYADKSATEKEYNEDAGPIKHAHSLFDIAFVRSKDLGVTWDSNATIVVKAQSLCPVVFTNGYSYDEHGSITGGLGTKISSTGPSYAVNMQNGFIYLVYPTNEFRKDGLCQIGLATSRDGGLSWSSPIQINPNHQYVLNPQAFSPSVAVSKSGYVAILYTDFRNDNLLDLDKTKADKWLAIYKEVKKEGSTGIGLDFVTELRLTDESYIVQNGPKVHNEINSDASSIVSQDDLFFAVYTKTHAGPFLEPTHIFHDKETKLLSDDNYRQSPYISIIKP